MELWSSPREAVGKYDKPKNFDDDNDDNRVFLDIPGAKFSESEFPFESCYIDSSKAFSQCMVDAR